jgi:hypothetical protein
MWSKPEVIEIKMDAEIGSYQQDDREDAPGDREPLIQPVDTTEQA